MHRQLHMRESQTSRFISLGDLEMITKNITKFVVAIALTLAVAFGTGVVGEQAGLPIVPSAHAGNCNSSAGGGC